jgi:hypothetical protein
MSKASTAPLKNSEQPLSESPRAPLPPPAPAIKSATTAWNAYDVWRQRVFAAPDKTPKKPLGSR